MQSMLWTALRKYNSFFILNQISQASANNEETRYYYFFLMRSENNLLPTEYKVLFEKVLFPNIVGPTRCLLAKVLVQKVVRRSIFVCSN